MNWALVSLRVLDTVPAEGPDGMIASIERMMTRGRGFIQFATFNQFLMKLYLTRAAGRTVAELYRQIIAWFEERNGRNR